MAWNLPQQNDNWATPEYLGQLVKAVRERQKAIGQAPADLPVEGAYITNASLDFLGSPYHKFNISFRAIQEWIETNCIHYMDTSVTIDGETARTPLNLEFPKWTLATFREAAGLNANGFTRIYGNPPQIGYGLAQAGDLVTTALFQELASALNRLIWIQYNPMPELGAWGYRYNLPVGNVNQCKNATYPPYPYYFDWIDLQNAVNDIYDNQNPSELTDSFIPQAYTTEQSIWGGGFRMIGNMVRYRQNGKVIRPNTTNACAVDFYLFQAVPGYFTTDPAYGKTYDTNGDHNWAEATWTKIETVGPTTDENVMSSVVGLEGLPKCNWVPVQLHTYEFRGWYTIHSRAVLRWDIEGGFNYYDSGSN